MKQLWDRARLYGLVRLHTLDNGCYHCCITFNTIQHVKLEALSRYNCETPELALQEAISKAVEIINSITKPLNYIKELTDGKSTST